MCVLCSNGLLPGILEIYHDHGVLGFFRGIVPRLIGDTIHLFACGILRYLIRTQVYCEELRACMGVSTSVRRTVKISVTWFLRIQCVTFVFIQILVGSLTYPFTVVSNTMIVSGAR